MLQKVKGLILRTVKYSETSIIFDAFTLEFGLRTYIISGVRKKNAKVSLALVRPMSLVEMVVFHQEDKDINRIKELKPSFIFQQIPFDIYKGTIGLFMTEIAQKTIKERSENSTLYYFLIGAYQHLDRTNYSLTNYPLWFLMQYAGYLGISPELSMAVHTDFYDYKISQLVQQRPGHTAYFTAEQIDCIKQLDKEDYASVSKVKISILERRQLLQQWLAYYQYHIAGFGSLNSLEVLREVF